MRLYLTSCVADKERGILANRLNSQFPDSVPELKHVALEYMRLAEEVSMTLTDAIESALGVSEGQLQAHLGLRGKHEATQAIQSLQAPVNGSLKHLQIKPEEIKSTIPEELPYGRMKLVRYGQEGNVQGVGAHRDGGWVSVLGQDLSALSCRGYDYVLT